MSSPYKTSDDKWLQLAAVVFDKYFPTLMTLFGREDLIGNPHYTIANISANHLNREVCSIVQEGIAGKTMAEWAELFTANDIPYAPMQSWEEVLRDEQAWANDVFYKMKYPKGERILVRMPVQLEEEGLPDFGMGPLLGEHSEEVIRELGYDDAQMAQLKAAKAYIAWDDIKEKYIK